MMLLVNNVVEKMRRRVTNTISLYSLNNDLLLFICFKRIVHELKNFRFLKITSDKSNLCTIKIMNICRLNHSSKVCMKKDPARHTRTPPSSLPEPDIILILYFLYCRDSVPKPIFLSA